VGINITSIDIEGIGGIKKLNLEFNKEFNIICGPNGVGKTTIIDCIAHSFSSNRSQYIKRNADSESGYWEIKGLTLDDRVITHKITRSNFHPTDPADYNYSNFHVDFNDKITDQLIVFKTNRSFQYMTIDSIGRDNKQQYIQDDAVNGIVMNETKNWFISRHVWSYVPESAFYPEQLSNLNLAKTLFGALDSNVEFSQVKMDTYDILLKQKNGSTIYFEYLSSGYKSVIYILLGLVKEIELRYKDPHIKVEDFSGLVIIDEVDLHLHPEWQASLIRLLKSTFPKAQFIVTTHSPHMLQVAEPDEIIPLGFDQNGNVYLRAVPQNEFGYQGWTVEEILTDVMGLTATTSETFSNALNNFENALSEDNATQANYYFKLLDKMLHPNNHLRKLLKIQMASLGDFYDQD